MDGLLHLKMHVQFLLAHFGEKYYIQKYIFDLCNVCFEKKSIPSAVVTHYCAWYTFFETDVITLHIGNVHK